MSKTYEFGVVGLGRMGGGLAMQALEKGMRVVGYDPRPPAKELTAAGLKSADSLPAFRELLAPAPRIIFLYVPAGKLVDRLLGELAQCLEPGDIVVDGGNSYWGDSIHREQWLRPSGIRLVDLGTSGGVSGARRGACFMAGGDRAAVEQIEPILRRLCVPGGYVYAGGPGSGHFVKLVHNGIEFGMLQAIGEGMALLDRFPERLPIADVLRCWQNGSVVRSWLVELLEQGYRDRDGFEHVPDYVDDTGEVNWLVADAMAMDVPTPVITQSVIQLIASRQSANVAARAVAIMRHGFGGHAFGPSEPARKERESGRVGGFPATDPSADAH